MSLNGEQLFNNSYYDFATYNCPAGPKGVRKEKKRSMPPQDKMLARMREQSESANAFATLRQMQENRKAPIEKTNSDLPPSVIFSNIVSNKN